MSERTLESRRGGRGSGSPWAERIRAAPLGVLILCALLFFVGAGLVLGGFYLAIARSDTGWVAWAMALLAGPTAIYLALHLLRLTSWAWLAAVVLLVLLLLSSAARSVGSADPIFAPLAELAVESLALLYLGRRSVRRAFRWS